jgi:hypothetical protein
MSFMLLLAATLFAIAPYVAFAQKDAPTDQAPKPTLADAQKVVELISNDESKLQTYCELGQLEDETAKTEDANETKAVEALVSKAEALAQQIGPEYLKLVEGLKLIDPKSVEGERFAAVLSALDDKCKYPSHASSERALNARAAPAPAGKPSFPVCFRLGARCTAIGARLLTHRRAGSHRCRPRHQGACPHAPPRLRLQARQ